MTEDAAHTLMPQVFEWNLVKEDGIFQLKRTWKTFTKGLEFFKIEADLAESEVIGREWKKIFGEQFSLTIIRLSGCTATADGGAGGGCNEIDTSERWVLIMLFLTAFNLSST
ncbi:hypothetical protein Ahy_B05g079307 [Arachis hypogaea]|uniref:4a-hydroxytetrahydrobiopterin dehydratase n=1 Tax=Arachis hypogaea TaxID=3818 RepID=A0A444Z9H9_ARAHY|nr:hypothetical protein Ahy_B05g079307 [Arachis hypogaea]